MTLEALRREEGHQVSTRSLTTFVVPVTVHRVRLVGLFFDTDKAFLLPTAMPGLRGLRGVYDRHPRSNLLIVGHTDTVGTPEHNLDLSLERADSVAAFLTDDVAAWLVFFEESATRKSKQWGFSELQLMLSVLPKGRGKKHYVGPITGREDATTTQAIKEFQQKQALAVDGIAGPLTRRALIFNYMALDDTTLPRRNPKDGSGIVLTTHGCGESFPTATAEAGFGSTGTAPDNQEKQEDRRVELFFFGSKIEPPPPPTKKSKAGSSEYPAWRKLVQSTLDLSPGVHVYDSE